MKKTLVTVLSVAAFSAALFLAPVQPASAERSVSGGIPAFVRDAVRNTPEDALVGIGTANMAIIGMSRTIATARARADISRQLDSIVRTMISDYMAGSEIDPSVSVSFQESMTLVLSESRILGASVVDEDLTASGDYWVVVMLTRNNAAQEIAAATESASAPGLGPHFSAAMNAIDRMNAAFEQNNMAPIVVVDFDL